MLKIMIKYKKLKNSVRIKFNRYEREKNMNKDTRFLVELAKNANMLITDELEVKAKGNDGDLVTNFDLEIENYIIEKIKEKYPDFTIISEEFNSNINLTDNCFTIDPIDGTVNFANKIPLWGIQIACIKDGKTCSSVIFLPKLNELYYADETGAFLNGEKIQVNNLSSKKGMYDVSANNGVIGIAKMRNFNTFDRKFGAASVNFAWVACGRLSASIYRNNNVWDYIPGLYLVKQAGGKVFSEKGCHIGANNAKFLELLKKEARYIENEKIKVVTE